MSVQLQLLQSNSTPETVCNSSFKSQLNCVCSLLLALLVLFVIMPSDFLN